MVKSLKHLAVSGKVVAAAMLCLAFLYASPAQAQCLTNNQTGTHDGYYYSFWKDSGNVTFCLQSGGRYTSQWSNINNWVGGKGWNPGGRRTVTYSGTFSPNGNLVPHAVWVDDESAGRVLHRRQLGHLASTGRTGLPGHGDQRRRHLRCLPHTAGQPAIHQGNATFYQYWSVRQQKRVGGTITAGNHFDAWAATA